MTKRRTRNDNTFFDRLISFDKLRMNGRDEAQDERGVWLRSFDKLRMNGRDEAQNERRLF